MRLAIPDLISNSYFPAIAAVELGCFRDQGLDVELELLFPVTRTMTALRDGQLDLVAGAAHATLTAFPNWRGARLLAALAQRMYWLLVVPAGCVACAASPTSAAPGAQKRSARWRARRWR